MVILKLQIDARECDVRDLSKLCVVKEASNQGLRGSHSLEELSGTNVQEKVWKMMREIRYVVIGMSHQKDQSVIQGIPYFRVSFCKVVLEYRMKVRRFFNLLQSLSDLISSIRELDKLRRHQLVEPLILNTNSLKSSFGDRRDSI